MCSSRKASSSKKTSLKTDFSNLQGLFFLHNKKPKGKQLLGQQLSNIRSSVSGWSPGPNGRCISNVARCSQTPLYEAQTILYSLKYNIYLRQKINIPNT